MVVTLNAVDVHNHVLLVVVLVVILNVQQLAHLHVLLHVMHNVMELVQALLLCKLKKLCLQLINNYIYKGE